MKNYKKHKEVKCLKCGNETYHHSIEEDDDCEKINNFGLWCISVHDDDDEWYVCKNSKCGCFHMRCPKCTKNNENNKNIQLCKLMGHCGIFRGKNYESSRHRYRIPKLELIANEYIRDEIKKVCLEENKDCENNSNFPCLQNVSVEILDDVLTCLWLNDFQDRHSVPEYYTGDFNQYYIDENEIYTTGPDGGFAHIWKCPNCRYIYDISDK